MEAYDAFLNELVNSNKLEYSGEFALNWVNPYSVGDMQQKRDDLCVDISWRFKKTKPYYKSISPGCQICGEGKWSCLFITNKCNANCFYCPTSQNEDSVIFGEIESETDHLPLTHVRSKCSEEFLAKADKELKETIEYYRDSVTKACNIIISGKNV